MIRLERGDVAPPPEWRTTVADALPESFNQRARKFEALPLNGRRRREGFKAFAPEALPERGGKRDFPPLWRTKKYVKKALRAMSDGYCAYCQSPAENQFGDVEHFQPKSLFPTLTYEWDNYFFSCQLCNHRKSDRWPEHGSYVRPDRDDPSGRFVFHTAGGVAAVPGDADAGSTISDFGLDRGGLCKHRETAIKIALRPLKMAMELPELSMESRKLLVRAQLRPPLSAYSAAVNQCVRRLWDDTFPGQPL